MARVDGIRKAIIDRLGTTDSCPDKWNTRIDALGMWLFHYVGKPLAILMFLWTAVALLAAMAYITYLVILE
jgi:hypothetical protein